MSALVTAMPDRAVKAAARRAARPRPPKQLERPLYTAIVTAARGGTAELELKRGAIVRVSTPDGAYVADRRDGAALLRLNIGDRVVVCGHRSANDNAVAEVIAIASLGAWRERCDVRTLNGAIPAGTTSAYVMRYGKPARPKNGGVR